jgi:hypothetical protein
MLAVEHGDGGSENNNGAASIALSARTGTLFSF